MSNGEVEIITGRERRRRWGSEEKLRIVAETHERGARVSEVVARHDVYPSLLSKGTEFSSKVGAENSSVPAEGVRLIVRHVADRLVISWEGARGVLVWPS